MAAGLLGAWLALACGALAAAWQTDINNSCKSEIIINKINKINNK